MRGLSGHWAGGPPPFYLDPRNVVVVHSILRSVPVPDTEKVHGLLIGLNRLLWRLKNKTSLKKRKTSHAAHRQAASAMYIDEF
jgi:hypothetical protein